MEKNKNALCWKENEAFWSSCHWKRLYRVDIKAGHGKPNQDRSSILSTLAIKLEYTNKHGQHKLKPILINERLNIC